MTNVEPVAWLRYGGGQVLWDEICMANSGLKGIHAGSTSVADGRRFNREISPADDVKA